MKKFTLFLSIILIASVAVHGQEITETINIEIPADEIEAGQKFIIKNINGMVRVSGSDGDKIVINGTRELWKKRGEISSDEAEKIRLVTRTYQNNWYAYVDAPGTNPEFEDGELRYHMHWDDHDDKNRIQFSYDLEISVPRNMEVKASTINSGDLEVNGIYGLVTAGNVNGSVIIKDVNRINRAITVNGDVEVWLNEVPVNDIDFKTVNGSIDLYLPAQPDAVVEFESIHGELYTDFDQYKPLPARLNKTKHGDQSLYRINNNTMIQFGDGGPELNFKMVNGSAYIRQRES